MANNKVKNDAITSRDEDFAQWYTDVCRKEAELMDYSSVKGFGIYRWICFMGNDSSIYGSNLKRPGHEKCFICRC